MPDPGLPQNDASARLPAKGRWTSALLAGLSVSALLLFLFSSSFAPAQPASGSIPRSPASQAMAGWGAAASESPHAPDRAPVTAFEQRGADLYADLNIRRQWLKDRRLLSVSLPTGRSVRVRLSTVMTEGALLRFKGQTRDGVGDLYLRVNIRG